MHLELDHLLYAGPDLDELQAPLSALAGLQAQPGGRHTDQGTHNALLGLGPGLYLELIAPDPEGVGGDWAEALAYLDSPAMHAWCLRVPDAAETVARLEAAGLGARRVPGRRALPDGSELRWEMVLPVGHRFGGVLPFFIDWGASAHPAAGLTAAARFRSLNLRHPDADALAALLASLGKLPSGVDLAQGARPSLRLSLDGPWGIVDLSGGGGTMTAAR